MCGRYVVARTLTGNLPDLLANLPGWPTAFENFNIAPSTAVPVVIESADTHTGAIEQHAEFVHWGFVASWKKSVTERPQPINARIETVATNGMFRGAFRHRRCVVPATGYYEWHVGADGLKQPYFIHAPQGLAFAGIYEDWTGGDQGYFRSMAIITRASVGPAAWLHDRLPVMLEPGDTDEWLAGNFANADAAIDFAVSSSGRVAETLEYFRVDPRVGNVRNVGPELVHPLA